jgi:glycosyltransferase involved in cell wall biosynthesis
VHLIVNALSIGSMSGQHVVFGFLKPLARWAQGQHSISIVHYQREKIPPELTALGVKSIPVSDRYRHWAVRSTWEYARLPGLIRRLNGDVLLNVSGALAPRCSVPQAVLCQNPWCFVPEAQYGAIQKFKARLQRAGYRRAFANAEMMIYISNHLRSLYRKDNEGKHEKAAAIAYVGLDEDTFQAARSMRELPRESLTILSVSAMAPWKGADTLVEAVAKLHQRGIPAKLNLVGPWPVRDYETRIRELIQSLSLQNYVQILGRVPDDELHRLYATSKVYCLLSCCESFGIPAAEAMAFGTPTIGTDGCAIAEVCETAGRFGPAFDTDWAARTLEELLNDDSVWHQLSQLAVTRASEKLQWDTCASELRKLFELETLQPVSL